MTRCPTCIAGDPATLGLTVNPGGVCCWSVGCRSAAAGVVAEGLGPATTGVALEMLLAGDAAAGLG